MTPQQTRKLRRKLDPRHVRSREINGTVIQYLEGWHVVAEANRIFGFDGWDRETIETNCINGRANGSGFYATYVSRVRIRVRAGEREVIREGSGVGESTAGTLGQAHEMALKAAETDATKRALMTFGNAFGLSLYGTRGSGDQAKPNGDARTNVNGNANVAQYATNGANPAAKVLEPQDDKATPAVGKGAVDKSKLLISEPKRVRDKAHLRFVASRPCLICGRNRSQAHHLKFMQPGGLGVKPSDEFTVPLCSRHHRELHESGDEPAWWERQGIDPEITAKELWATSDNPG